MLYKGRYVREPGGPTPGSYPTAGGRKGPVIVYDIMTAPLCG